MRRRNERHVSAIEETGKSQDGSLRERRDQWVEEKLDAGITRRQRTRQEKAEDQKKPSSLCPFPTRHTLSFLRAIAFQITHISAFIRRQPGPGISALFYNALEIRDWDSSDATVAEIRELIANFCTLVYLCWNTLCIDLMIGINATAGIHTHIHQLHVHKPAHRQVQQIIAP